MVSKKVFSVLRASVWCRNKDPLDPALSTGSLSSNVFERRTSTGSGIFSFLDGGFAQIFSFFYNSKEAKEYKFYIIKAC